MSITTIAKIGEPILRGLAQPVEMVTEPHIAELINRLIETAISSQGVGIAAPQIHSPYRLIVVASRPSDRYPLAPTMAPTAMINPRILSHGKEVVKDWEGCLSIPNARGLVPRYRQIEVEYTTQLGEIKQEILTDFIARIFQHELDHLDGIVFTDHLIDGSDLYTEAEYRHHIAKLI
ncbi:MAG: peptide deformylase [Cyanobacteria bacterium J06621_12]